ncbi:MAG TPA: SdpI family protein [Thermoanaerobaculia bacterium]|nr:SdpI family protein [Thermoanaerobaculia bacterium]
MNAARIIHIAAGAFVALTAIPLALRLVPMNRYYGVRIPKAYRSDRNWYAINAFGGWLMLAYGVTLVVFGIFFGPTAPDPRSISSLPFVLGPMLLILPVLALIFLYARRLP